MAGRVAFKKLTNPQFEPLPVPVVKLMILRKSAVFAAGLLGFQLILGTLMRHLGWGVGTVLIHITTALLFTGMVLWLVVLVYGLGKQHRFLRRATAASLVLVQFQLIFGVLTFALPGWGRVGVFHHITALTLWLCMLAIAQGSYTFMRPSDLASS